MKRHLIGIGGVGMSALATALVRLGDEVTGADRTLGTPNIRFLESLGVRVFPDDGSGVDATTDEVIVSTAIEETNAGLRKAKELGIPVTHRAKALARTLQGYRLVAVVGTCGKSTVTAMLGHVLAACGLDPMCVNGANVPGWEGAVRFGKGRYAVAEVDESDKSLVAFSPYAAIVTNASADHYSKEEMDEVFDAFVKDLPGPLVDGRNEVEKLRCCEVEKLREVQPLPGAHNLQNATMAVAMAKALGVDVDRAIAAMKTFRGVERRLQLITRPPSLSSVQHSTFNIQTSLPALPAVYDDYAHNPEKLHAMWTTLAEKYPKGVCVIWRPHGYAPLRKMMDALAAMFAETVRPQDRLLLLPVYDAGGTTDRSINSDALVEKIASLRVSRVSSASSTSSTSSSSSSSSFSSISSTSSDPRDSSDFTGDTSDPRDSTGDTSDPRDSIGDTSDPRDSTGDTSDPRDSTGDTSDPRDSTSDSKDPILVADHDAAYDWCAAHRGDFGAFVTCGARDPGLPVLARRLSEL